MPTFLRLKLDSHRIDSKRSIYMIEIYIYCIKKEEDILKNTLKSVERLGIKFMLLKEKIPNTVLS